MKESKLKRALVAIYEKIYAIKIRLVRETYYRFKTQAYHMHIMSSAETIKYIKRTHCSIARYGDGEFDMITGVRDLKFQKSSPELGNALRNVLEEKNPNLLLCIPGTFNSISGCNWHAAMYWKRWGIEEKNIIPIYHIIAETCGKNYRFGNAQITRPYIDWESSKKAEQLFPMLKSLWAERDVIIVEGEQTRLGVGNDLFDGAKRLKRIICPAVGAFEKYDAILKAVIMHYSDNALVVMALGPTATVLASDLSKKGIQALDIGHIDVEYEWFLAKAKEKTCIKGKYVNEVIGGQEFSECNDPNYLKSIIDKIS